MIFFHALTVYHRIPLKSVISRLSSTFIVNEHTLLNRVHISYVKPRIGENQFGGESVTYEGIGSTKKWERIESYGPKFVENIVQAISCDILCYAMKTLRHCFIVGHVHDELIIECSPDVDLNVICKQMGRSPDWMPDILLRVDGYETVFIKKTDMKIAAPWLSPEGRYNVCSS